MVPKSDYVSEDTENCWGENMKIPGAPSPNFLIHLSLGVGFGDLYVWKAPSKLGHTVRTGLYFSYEWAGSNSLGFSVEPRCWSPWCDAGGVWRGKKWKQYFNVMPVPVKMMAHACYYVLGIILKALHTWPCSILLSAVYYLHSPSEKWNQREVG